MPRRNAENEETVDRASRIYELGREQATTADTALVVVVVMAVMQDGGLRGSVCPVWQQEGDRKWG